VEHQHRGIGSLLLATVLRQALELRDQHGCVGVVIDAKTEAVGYYATFGFQVVPTESGQIQGGAAPTTQMFLPIGTIETALRHDSHK
jgi:predicted N-acetyltransferase YhbS